MAAVNKDGNALQFVPESKMTESVIMAALNQNGDALMFVPEDFFSTIPLELTLAEIASKFGVDVSKIKIKM
jgi:hypothetical protein